MATVRILDNFLENKVDTFSVDAGITIETLIREHTSGDSYEGTLVECYDCDTGETFYAPLEDNSDTMSVIVQVNQKEVGLDYIIQKDDVVSVVVTPSDGGGLDWGAGILGAVLGGIAGGVIGYLVAGPVGAAYGAFLGATLGFSVGMFIGNDWNFDDSSSGENGLESKDLPDVRGAQNQPLTDNPFPFVLGKHLTTPFILGSPWNEIYGTHGENNYIHCLYVVGYGPLRLTDFKLGEMMLAHNQSWSGNPSLKNIFHGALHGTDPNAGSGQDAGEIVNTWGANDITIEILQQPTSGQVNYGSIYPYAKIQTDVKANILYIADGDLEGIDKENNISYKGLGLKNGLRNNRFQFTEQYPASIRVELDFPNGMFKSRSETKDKKSKVKYSKIPMWVAIQWRVYSEDNEATKGENHGEFNDLTWIPDATVDGKVIPGHFSDTRRSWHSFGSINGISPETFTEAKRNADIDAHTGNNLTYKTTVTRTRTNDQGQAETYTEEITAYRNINTGWYNGKVFNLQPLGGTNDEQDGINEFRCITEVDFVSWARQNIPYSSEEDFIKKFKAYFFDGSNTTNSIEVRVVRISPCYIDETTSTNEHSAYKFNDVFTWTTLTSTMLDGEKLLKENQIVQKRPLDEDRMRKLCVVAIKAKTDNTDQLSSTLRKFTCTAQSFSPYYDSEQKKWLPENIDAVTKYYNKNGQLITKAQFEADHQSDDPDRKKSIRVAAGNNYYSVMDSIIRNNHTDSKGRIYIPDDDTLKYCNNNVASMFLLAGIGPHLGKDALGYTQTYYDNGTLKESLGDFNLKSLGKWYEWAEHVTDGSTYGSAGYHYKHDGTREPHGANDTVEMYFTANAYIYQAEQLESILSKIAVAGRALYTRDSKNRLTVVIDKPEQYPVALINQANTLKSSYTLSFAENPSGLQIVYPDEDDGYNNNTLYCMANGEDPKNPRSAIEQYKFSYVTNGYQQWSLGRYLLANRVLNKEVVTKQLGIEGASIGLGNLVVVQDDLMLIGTDTGGRITELIEDTNSIYGFLVDNTYHFTGEFEYYDENDETKTRSVQGVTVMQPSQYKESRIINIRLAMAGTTRRVRDKDYTIEIGNTNLVLFDNPISKTDNSIDGDTVFVYKPVVGNIVGFGLCTSTTALYRVIKIKPDAKRTYEFTLMKYQEDLYNYGDVLPSFQNNMTLPDRTNEDAFALTNYVTSSELVEALAQASKLAQGKIDDTFSDVPPAPSDFTADVRENCIQFKCAVQTAAVNNIDHIVYEITRPDGTITTIDGSYSTEYYFNRADDGFPEKSALRNWRFRAKAVSIYLDSEGNKIEGDWCNAIRPSDESLLAYGTWIPPIPVLTEVSAGEEGITVKWACDLSNVYGVVQFNGRTYYDGALRTTQTVITNGYTYLFNRSVDGYPEKPTIPDLPQDTLTLDKYSVTVTAVNITSGATAQSLETDCTYSNYLTWIPPVPIIGELRAGENGISCVWTCDTSRVYGTVQYHFDIFYNDTRRETQTVITKNASYLFDRLIDGYPEKPNAIGMKSGTLTLDNYSGRVRAENIISRASVESSVQNCDYSMYLTWIPSSPKISSRVSNRNITIYFSQQEDCYGLIQYLVGVRRIDDPSDIFYVPDLSTNPYSRETAYKLASKGTFVIGKLESETLFSQTMPLETQNGIEGSLDVDESESDNRLLAVSNITPGENKLLSLGLGGYAPIDTTYQFEVYAYNKTVENFYDKQLEIHFEDLQTPSAQNIGLTQKIKESFVSTSDFEESGVTYPANTIVKIKDVGSAVQPNYKYVITDTLHDYDKDTYHKVSVNFDRKLVTALATSVQDVLNGSIISDKVGQGAITETKIEDEAISTPKLRANAVIGDRMYAYNLITLTEGAHAISGFAASDGDEEWERYVEILKHNRSDTLSIDNYIKRHSNNYWIGLDTSHPEFYMGNVVVGQKASDEANYFHYYTRNNETNLDIKLSNFIVTAISSTIKGFFNVRNKNGEVKYDGAASFLQVNPESEQYEEETVQGYYDAQTGKFYEDTQHTIEIFISSTKIYEDKSVSPHKYYRLVDTDLEEVSAYSGTTPAETMILKGDFQIVAGNEAATTGKTGNLTVAGLSNLTNLSVTGSSNLSSLTVSGTSELKTTNVKGSLTVGTGASNNNLVVNGVLSVTANSSFSNNLTVSGSLLTNTITPASGNTVSIPNGKSLSVGTDLNVGGITQTATGKVSGKLIVGATATPSYDLQVGTSSASKTARVYGSLTVSSLSSGSIEATNGVVSTTTAMTLSAGIPATQTVGTTKLFSNGLGLRGAGSDGAWIRFIESNNDGKLEIATGDDGNEPIYVRQYNSSGQIVREISLLDASGNTIFPGNLSANTITARIEASRLRIPRGAPSNPQYGDIWMV